jgi:signal peptidase I
MPTDSSKPASADGGIKETLESILIAFILAFIFRAFVVEAFVIPTGSMAPTLMGAHMRFRCPDCGYRFDVNYPSESEGDDMNIPSVAGPIRVMDGARIVDGRRVPVSHLEPFYYPTYCPNCGYKIDRENPTNEEDAAQNPPVYYGDRILVLKYLYLFRDPHRWDVVVFKNPNDPTHQYQTNYIKRLIGKPGETIMVLDGNVYIANNAGTEPSDFTVQTKPRWAQEALWRIVYDNDFYPKGRQRDDGQPWVQPWQQQGDGTGWNLGDANTVQRVFKFDNAGGASTITFNKDANPNQNAMTDWVAYDVTGSPGPPTNVSDLKLDCFYQRNSGDGPLRMQLTKREEQFTAEIYSDHVQLLHSHAGGLPVAVGDPVAISPQSGPMHIEFSNVDYRVTLRIGTRDLIQTTPEQYHPDIPALLEEFRNGGLAPPPPTVQINAGHQSCVLSHVSLWRDVYYTTSEPHSSMTWAIPKNFPHHLVHLGKDEYFVLGDNSAISGDARYWTIPVELPDENLFCEPGRVPGRFLLGKAFFVYWPAGFRPVSGAPSIIPDFGDMRFIH